MTARTPSFTIPQRPRRRYPHGGGVEYEGETVFELIPDADREDGALEERVVEVLERGPYRFGDFLELPMPLYLVRDDGTTDVFRVVIRDGAVRLYVLPETDSEGLRRFYERLTDRSDTGWHVDCRTGGA
jgi:hypothetical protein